MVPIRGTGGESSLPEWRIKDRAPLIKWKPERNQYMLQKFSGVMGIVKSDTRSATKPAMLGNRGGP